MWKSAKFGDKFNEGLAQVELAGAENYSSTTAITQQQADMYGNTSPFASHGQRASNMYNRVGVETDVLTASPHRLVSLLLEGAFDSMTQGIGAIRAGNVEIKNRSLSRAVRILDEGLKAALDLETGALAHDLRDLYAYMCMRLTHANLHADDAAVEECARLLQPIREAWASIAPAAAEQRVAA